MGDVIFYFEIAYSGNTISFLCCKEGEFIEVDKTYTDDFVKPTVTAQCDERKCECRNVGVIWTQIM